MQDDISQLSTASQRNQIGCIEFDKRRRWQECSESRGDQCGLGEHAAGPINRRIAEFDHDVIDLANAGHKDVRNVRQNDFFPAIGRDSKEVLLRLRETACEPQVDIKPALRQVAWHDSRGIQVVTTKGRDAVRQRHISHEQSLTRKHVEAPKSTRPEIDLAVNNGCPQILAGTGRAHTEGDLDHSGCGVDLQHAPSAGFRDDQAIRCRDSSQSADQRSNRGIDSVNIQRINDPVADRIKHMNVNRPRIQDVDQAAQEGNAIVFATACNDRIGIQNLLCIGIDLVKQVGAVSIQEEQTGAVEGQSITSQTRVFRGIEPKHLVARQWVEFHNLIRSVDRRRKQPCRGYGGWCCRNGVVGLQTIRSPSTKNAVVTVATSQRVRTTVANQCVIPVVAVDQVVRTATDAAVVTRTQLDRVTTTGSVDVVIASATVNRIASTAAIDRVVAFVAADQILL